MGGEGREGEALCPSEGCRGNHVCWHTLNGGALEKSTAWYLQQQLIVFLFIAHFFHLPTHFSKYWVPTEQRKDTRIMENKLSSRSPQRLLSNRIPPKGKQADVRFGGAVPVMGSGPHIIKEPADK